MEKLWRLFRHLGDSLDLDETLATFDHELRAVVEYSSIAIHLRENGCLTPAYLAGLDFQRIPALEVYRPVRQPGLSGFAPLSSMMAAPLEESGVVALYRQKPFADPELNVLTAAASKLVGAARNALAYRAAAMQAGIAGAGALFRKLDSELSRCTRESASLAVLACKIEGAASAREAAWGRLRDTCREYDFAAVSGDEFVLVLAGFTARDLPEKQTRIEAIAAATGVSARVGAAFYPEDGKDSEDLLATASRRLHG